MAISKIENASLATSAVGQSNMGTGVAGTGPAFSAGSNSNQSFSAATSTKLSFANEEFDTNSNYDTTTYRFTPTVAGYYQVNIAVQFSGATSGINTYIFKNGVAVKACGQSSGTNALDKASVSAILYMNGSSDYIEAYAWVAGALSTTNNSTWNYFQAALVRAA